jgi:hypothetical protein
LDLFGWEDEGVGVEAFSFAVLGVDSGTNLRIIHRDFEETRWKIKRKRKETQRSPLLMYFQTDFFVDI